jgi:hypothetical protein
MLVESSQAALRAELAASRSSARRAVTALQASITAWNEAIGGGRSALSELSNLRLRQLHLPELSLGKMNSIPGLRDAAEKKLKYQIHKQQDALATASCQLHQALQQMMQALMQLHDQQRAARTLAGLPVFACLTVQQLCKLVDGVVEQYTLQYQVSQVTCSPQQWHASMLLSMSFGWTVRTAVP